MIYAIRLTIAHHYEHTAANSRHLIRVVPRSLPGRQSLILHQLDISPDPVRSAVSTDFFFNTVQSCAHREPHTDMSITLTCQVRMDPQSPWLDMSPDVATLTTVCDRLTDLGPASPLHFLGPSPRLPPNNAISAFAHDHFDAGASTLDNVVRIGKALHDAMTFDATATTVETDAAEAFRLRRGVCQDFSHIMILALQSLGIPVGYVSGYLRTLPPPGAARLEGADAMHAWVQAWCGPDQGWVEYDPTNATRVGSDHIVAGYGRDYSDVSPLRGHLRSSGGQTNSQSVDVAIVG